MTGETIREILKTIYHHSLFRFVAVTAGLVLGVGLLADLAIMPMYTRHGEPMMVPDVTAVPIDEAKTRLENSGFHAVAGEERFSSECPNGYVLEQTPRPHSNVKGGRRIYLVVSRGERLVQMPMLVERSERDAQLLLSRYGLILGEVNYEYSSFYPEGTISFQSLAPRSEVAPGTRVSITVSAGPLPNEFVVPAVSGRPFDDAAKMIRKAGLVVGTVRYEDVADLLPETVIGQSIEAGAKVDKGTKIDLVVSRLPDNPQPR